jgi:hypothetical protein
MTDFIHDVFAALNISDPTLKQADSFKQVMNKYYPSLMTDSAPSSKGAKRSSKSTSPVKSMTYTRYVALMLANRPANEEFFNMKLNLTVDNISQIFSKLSDSMRETWDSVEDESKVTLSECPTLGEFYDAISSAYKSLQQKKSIVVGILTFIKFKIPEGLTVDSTDSAADSITVSTEPVEHSKSEPTKTKETKPRKQKENNKRGLDFFRKFISGVTKGLFKENADEVAQIKEFYSKHEESKPPLIRMNNLFSKLNDEQKEFYNTFFTEFPEITNDNEAEISKMLVETQTELVEKFHDFFLNTEAETEATETETEEPKPTPVVTKKIGLKR